MTSGRPEPSGEGATTTSATQTAPQRSVDGSVHRAAHHVDVVDEQAVPVDVQRLARLARHVLEALEVPTELELTITCVDVDRIAALNVAHLDGDGPTDVLAFPIDAPDDVHPGVPGLLGDIVLCPQVAVDQAGEHGRDGGGAIDMLIVHGALHLLGHDHAEPAERRRMFTLTDALLASFAGAP